MLHATRREKNCQTIRLMRPEEAVAEQASYWVQTLAHIHRAHTGSSQPVFGVLDQHFQPQGILPGFFAARCVGK
jgi:hypothetical protein